jgi:diguanylate cyclase (GGDEF)-like protein
MHRALDRAGLEVEAVGGVQEGLEALRRSAPRVVVCDYFLPDGQGLSVCSYVRQNADLHGTYFILVSASDDVELPTRALNCGADDYLRKPMRLSELTARIRVGMRMWTMHDQLRQAAITDGLTQLYNHDHINRLLELEMSRARRYGHPMAVMMLDIDYFKAINDTYGHMAGNTTLQRIAQVLRDSVRDVDTIGRFGGEEFIVLLPSASSAHARQVAERIRQSIADLVRPDPLHQHVVTASVGLSDTEDPRVHVAADLIDLADQAMYLAKRSGRNRVACSVDLKDESGIAPTIQTDEVEWLRRRIAALSVRAKDMYIQSVASLLQALDEKDPYTGRHAVNVAYYAKQLGDRMGLSPASVKSVHNAALLHDIGKVGVPDRILMKQTSLTPIERMVIDQVPLIGTRIVDHLRILESEIQIIRHQREHFDGTGSPSGLAGERIPIGSRILLAADAFDAMTTDRIYRERRPIDEVMIEIRRLAGTQFDPAVVAALDELVSERQAEWQARIGETIATLRIPTAV